MSREGTNPFPVRTTDQSRGPAIGVTSFNDLPKLIKVLQRKLGLTPREAEVLAWITIGKTNPEIAQILIPRCKPRTVATHVRHIFTKLGVERRTAAACRVFEVLQQQGPPEPLP